MMLTDVNVDRRQRCLLKPIRAKYTICMCGVVVSKFRHHKDIVSYSYGVQVCGFGFSAAFKPA